MRLNRYLALCGIASRRRSEDLILAGRVELNGEVVTELATQVEPGDDVKLDGMGIQAPKKYSCWMFNKPLE